MKIWIIEYINKKYIMYNFVTILFILIWLQKVNNKQILTYNLINKMKHIRKMMIKILKEINKVIVQIKSKRKKDNFLNTRLDNNKLLIGN